VNSGSGGRREGVDLKRDQSASSRGGRLSTNFEPALAATSGTADFLTEHRVACRDCHGFEKSAGKCCGPVKIGSASFHAELQISAAEDKIHNDPLVSHIRCNMTSNAKHFF
jgi:hypothetical protein